MSVDYTIPKDEIRAGQFEIDGDVFVRVVRCRDCKYLHRDDPWWECHRAGFYVGAVDGSEPDGFCAWGERKVEGC